MTTTIAEIATYLPPTSMTVEQVGKVLGLRPAATRMYRRFYGLDQVRWAPDEQLIDLLIAAASRLELLRGNEHRVRYLLHARSIEPAAPYSLNPLHQARDKLGLTNAVTFAVSQHACASGLLAVGVAGRMLAADGDADALALVLTGEKTYPHVTEVTPAVTVMAEATAACLVRIGGTRDRLLASASHTYGEFHDITIRTGDIATAFEQNYPVALEQVVQAAVERAGLSLADISLVLPHNVNRISWVQLCHRLGYPVERVYLDNVPVTGHCFCADPFINYRSARSLLRPGDHYLMASVGLGATFSAMVFQH